MTADPKCDSIALYCDCLTNQSDRQLIERLRQGDNRTASVLYQRFARRLLSRLDSDVADTIKGEFDADRALQIVFRNSLQRTTDGLYSIPMSADLWPILFVVALSKLRDRSYAPDREDPELGDPAESGELDVVGRAIDQLDLSEPESLLRLVIAETLCLMPPFQRQCLEWRLEGLDVAQIAKRVGRTKRSIERTLLESRDTLRDLMLENDNVLLH